ncbi:MAG: DegQ family serine endoprotease [Nitrospinota bacterium]
MGKLSAKISTFLTMVVMSTFLVSFPSPLWGKGDPGAIVGSNIFVEIAAKENPAVVHISTTTKPRTEQIPGRRFRGRPPGQQDPFRDFFDRFFGPQRNVPRRSLGSGFIIDKEGYLFTNNHVVERADEIKVTLENGDEYDAKVIGTDPKTDIALIKIDNDKNLPVVELGDSDELQVGEWVMAIGNPFGLNHTVTVGVVSAKGRVIGSGPYDDYIQTDASINPGNSGGPLINTKGKVIGISSAIYAGSTGGNIGIGFAIPINLAKSIMEDLKTKGAVTRGRLGVMIQKITPELAKSFNLSENEGALVGDVIKGSPAERSGIERGDVIVEFNGQPVKTMEELPKIVAQTRPGSEVDVVVVRDGKRKVIKTTIDKLEEAGEIASSKIEKMGLRVQDITPELMQSLDLDSQDGVLVADVIFDSPASAAGIRRGDVIAEINREKINNLHDFQGIMNKLDTEDTVLLLIKRGGSTIFVAVKMK